MEILLIKRLKMQLLSFSLSSTWKQKLAFRSTFCSRDASNVKTRDSIEQDAIEEEHRLPYEFVWSYEEAELLLKVAN